jgi:glucokinase
LEIKNGVDETLVLGVDLGGTHLRIGAVSPTGNLHFFSRERVDSALRGDDLIEIIYNYASTRGILQKLDAVGIGLAGTIVKGGLLKPEHMILPGLGDYPLANRLANRFQLPCELDNDANLALLGESHFGAAKGMKNVLLLTLGTGIGGGLLLGGKIWEGTHSSATEVGLTMIGDPINGSVQPVEDLISPGTIMSKLGKSDGLLFERVKKGDRYAQELATEMFQGLGFVITNIHLLLDLELVLISGGLAAVGDSVCDSLQTAFDSICPQQYKFNLRFEIGKLRPDTAGVIGAACQWFERQGILPKIKT